MIVKTLPMVCLQLQLCVAGTMVKLSLPAVRQVLYLAGVTTASDEKEFSSKIQRSASRSAGVCCMVTRQSSALYLQV